MAEAPAFQNLLLRSVTFEAGRVNSYEFVSPGGIELPAFTAGAHIDIKLTPELTRSYSLTNPQTERHRYVVAVQKEPQGRGGSRRLHETLHAGDIAQVSAPINNFPLAEDASRSVFVAGGIGITPVWCMIQRMHALNRPWELHYCTRTRESAAFLEPLTALHEQGSGLLNAVFDHEPEGKTLDIGALVAATPPDAHLYCCGPTGMLEAFERATAQRAPGTVHVEYFSARLPPAEGGFTVVLAKSGREIFVPDGTSILETLLAQGLMPAHSCREGVCGTCETEVIEGIPDHRDVVLSESERSSNKTMMICCSGCKGDRLVLNL